MTTRSTLLGRIGRALRTMAHNYAVAREIEARRLAFSRLDANQLEDIGVDRFGTPFRDVTADLAPPASANDDHPVRRAA
jgi:hypothetical protein